MRQLFVFLLFAPMLMAQTDYRTWLRGKILYQNQNVIAANVVNTTTKEATISDNNGDFAIQVMMGDELVFTSLQYQIRVVKVTKEILQRGRLIIDVNEKITELEEVVVTPEQRQKFLDLRAEEFKKFDYERDRSPRLENELMNKDQLTNGVNFVSVFKALYRMVENKGKAKHNQKPSKVCYLRSVMLCVCYVLLCSAKFWHIRKRFGHVWTYLRIQTSEVISGAKNCGETEFQIPISRVPKRERFCNIL